MAAPGIRSFSCRSACWAQGTSLIFPGDCPVVACFSEMLDDEERDILRGISEAFRRYLSKRRAGISLVQMGVANITWKLPCEFVIMYPLVVINQVYRLKYNEFPYGSNSFSLDFIQKVQLDLLDDLCGNLVRSSGFDAYSFYPTGRKSLTPPKKIFLPSAVTFFGASQLKTSLQSVHLRMKSNKVLKTHFGRGYPFCNRSCTAVHN